MAIGRIPTNPRQTGGPGGSATPVRRPAGTGGHREQRGVTAIEILVSFTLLTAVLSAAVPLVARHSRLLAEQRSYRIALDELSNQLERITHLPSTEVPAAIETLALSQLAESRLADAALEASHQVDAIGTRVTLSLAWGDPARRAAPLVLTGWVVDRTPAASDSSPGDKP